MSIDRRVLQRVRFAAEVGVRKAAEHVLDVSKADTPVDEGDLKRSGEVKPHGLKVAITYSDPVAIIVHENMQAEHDQGHAKFLENAMNSERGKATEIVAAEIRRQLGG